MNSRSFHVALGVFALAPIAAAQDSDESVLQAPTRPIVLPSIQLPPSPSTSSPGRVQVLFTNIATSSTSDVPGAPLGTKFTSGSGSTNFDKPWVTPTGSHWAIRADTPLATTEDSVLMVDGTVFMREGTPTPFNPLTNWGPTDIRVGLLDNGDVALFTNTTEAANDDYVLKYTAAGGTWTVIAQEAMTIPALPTSTWDDDLDSISLLADGRIALHGDLIDGGGILTANDEILVIDNVLIAQEGITVPTGQAAAGTLAWENFTFENTWVSLDGLNVLIDGDLTGTTNDDVTTYNGAVVIQEGFPIPGTAFTSAVVSGGPDEIYMDAAGRWYARGNNADGQDWVVRNGTVLAKTDDLLTTSGDRVRMTATLNAAQVVPPGASTATGTGTFLVDTSNNTLTYDITLTGLLTSETGATINGFAAAGGTGAPLYVLPAGNAKQGVIVYAESEEPSILAGLTYVEITTTGNPGGEIRGQIVVGSESWDDADFADGYFAMCGNGLGDFVIGGLTNAPSLVNGVLVLNNSVVLAREGDPVDVDGNGLYDDNAFFNTFGNDDCVLLDDGSLYFTATLKDSANTAFAQGVFVRRAGNLQRAYCFGDGSGASCPCANFSAVGQMAGCVNSLGTAGRLDTTGIASVTSDTLVLNGTLVPNGPGLYFQGVNQLGGGLGLTFGDGLRCTGGSVIRLGIVVASGNTSTYPTGVTPPNNVPISVKGFATPGAVLNYQLWYRDSGFSAGDYCTPAAFNLTNAISVTWGN